MNKLIVAEKPSVAIRIAMALGESRPRTENFNGIRYFVVTKDQDQIFIVAAAGHLFTLTQVGPNKTPVFDIEWIPSYKVSTGAYFTKKYLDAIEIVGKQCTFFINACDYDIEGTVIGTNIIKQVMNKNVNSEISVSNVKRMRFSTTTNADLIASYANLNEFDGLNFDAGRDKAQARLDVGHKHEQGAHGSHIREGDKEDAERRKGPGTDAEHTRQARDRDKELRFKALLEDAHNSKGVNFESSNREIFDKGVAEQYSRRRRQAP